MCPREEILTIMIDMHDYGESRIAIIQSFMVSFLENDSRLIIENGAGDQDSRHPESIFSFGIILEIY